MKTGSFILLSFLGLAIAQPHGHKHARFHHAKRAVVTDIVTVTATAPEAVVYVDPQGNVLYTTHASGEVAAAAVTPSSSAEQNEAPPASLSYSAPPAPSTSSSPSKSSTSSPPPPSTTAKPATTTSQAAAAPPASKTTTAIAGGSGGYIGGSGSSSSSGAFSNYGLSYSPYKDDGTCMTQDEVSADFDKMPSFGFVRSYGCDCNQVTTMLTAAKAKGMKVFLGVFDLTQVSSEISQMVSQVNGDWDHVWAVAIGNEDVNQGKATPAAVVTALNSGRSQLRAAGYHGPVVHVDTFNQIIDHPEMCENSDFAAANCHAFFDPNTPAASAGDFVLEQAQAVSKACGGKNTWITESGWPNAGTANDKAIPSLANQQTALDSIKSKFSGGNVVLFSAFNDVWKKNSAGTYDAEQHWGILDASLKGF